MRKKAEEWKRLECGKQWCPGDVLREEFLEPLGVTAYRLAKEVGVTQIQVSMILRGKRGISAEMAVRLGRYFGVPARFWMDLQSEWELERTEPEIKGVERCAKLQGMRVEVGEVKVGCKGKVLVGIKPVRGLGMRKKSSARTNSTSRSKK